MKIIFRTLVILTLCASIPTTAREIEKDPSKGALVKMCTISGSIGLPGVEVKGFPGAPVVTDENGVYSAQVPYGWCGLVKPFKIGYRFEPPRRVYDNVSGRPTSENYAAEFAMVTIRARIARTKGSNAEPIEGVLVTAEPGGYTSTTDAGGWYEIQVPYGWSGEFHFTKDGAQFGNMHQSMKNVTDGDSVGEFRSSSMGSPRMASRGLTTRARFDRLLNPLSAFDVLVIPTRQVAPESFAQTTEDMYVMAHILREELSEPRTIRGVLYDYGDFFSSSDRDLEAIYLQGYGVLFVVRLDTPFSFAQEPSVQDPNAMESSVDPVWRRARETMRGPRGSRTPWSAQDDRVSFEQFKEDLLKTLKHATNIRHIDPNEWIILTVLGQESLSEHSSSMPRRGGSFSVRGGGGGYASGGTVSGGYSSSGGGSFYSYSSSSGGSYSGGPVPSTRGDQTPDTVLTIQATKADIDAFATGDIDFEQFQAKSKTFSY